MHAAEAFVSSPSRILIADDEHLVALNISTTLQDLGYEIIGPASDGDAAVEMARGQPIDLALLDIRMPVRDGLSAAKQLYMELGIPAIMLTAYSDSTHVTGAKEAGVFGYLVKPVHARQLQAAIQVAWHQFRRYAAEAGENARLRQRLEDRKLIEQAKWILVQRDGIAEPEAMKLINRAARDNHRTVVAVSEEILRGMPLPAGHHGHAAARR